MAERTIALGIVTYRGADGVEGRFGMHGDNVDVHEDDLERFDRLNGAEPVEEPEAIEEPEEIDIPEDDPTTDWSAKQLDKYAAEFGIDLSAAKNKPEKVAAIAAASVSE